MNLQEATSSAIDGVKALSDGLVRFAKVERVLAGFLAFTPLGLWIADDMNVRGSISAYYDVSWAPAFYFPLTVAAMLFFVNGILRDRHVYNVLLGLALSGVILFDTDGGSHGLHMFFAVAFFAGNFVVMGVFAKNKSPAVIVGLASGALVAGVLLIAREWFWMEVVSLGVIAVHFLLDSLDSVRYRALRPGEAPSLAA